MEKLISVIIPVYNVEQYLRQCLDSVVAQTYRNLEIILVDDGTKDSGGEICDEYAEKDSRITVIHKENGGLSSARNAGIDVAKGEYLGFVDSDDWIEPDAYGSMMALAEKTGAKLVCGGRYDFSERRNARRDGMCPQKEETISSEEMLRRLFLWDNCDSAAWDKLYHRSLFEGIRYPIGKYYEDVAIAYLLIEKAGTVAMLPRRIYNYRHRKNSITVAPLTDRTFHFEQHTEVIYHYVSQHFPKIEPEARFLRIKSLRYTVLSGELAPKDVRQKYRQQIEKSRKELRGHAAFIRKSPLFTKLERRQDLALAYGIYGWIHRLRHPGK